MRSAVLPAEITSVEDKLAANLNLKQVILMIIPIILTGIIYFILPPINRLVLYKIVVSSLLLIIFLISSLRINNKIIIEWAIITGRYFIRPKVYVYRKGFSLRTYMNSEYVGESEIIKTKPKVPTNTKVNHAELAEIQSLIQNENLKLDFKAGKKGGLYGSISRV